MGFALIAPRNATTVHSGESSGSRKGGEHATTVKQGLPRFLTSTFSRDTIGGTTGRCICAQLVERGQSRPPIKCMGSMDVGTDYWYKYAGALLVLLTRPLTHKVLGGCLEDIVASISCLLARRMSSEPVSYTHLTLPTKA